MRFEEETATLCRNITYLRRSACLSVPEMAALLRISEEELTAIEAGSIPETVSTEIFIGIRRNFGITPHAMLTLPLDPP